MKKYRVEITIPFEVEAEDETHASSLACEKLYAMSHQHIINHAFQYDDSVEELESCQHNNYSEHFGKCDDCGATVEEVKKRLNSVSLARMGDDLAS